MMQKNSLRFRVAIIFALFGGLLSIAFSSGFFWMSKEFGHHVMDESLELELEDSAAFYERYHTFALPNSVAIKAYVFSDEYATPNIPEEVKSLPVGNHNVEVDEISYRVRVADKHDARYYLFFNTENQHIHEAQFVKVMMLVAAFVTTLAAIIGFWLAATIIKPLSKLSNKIGTADPEHIDLAPANLARDDEVGELARAFTRYQQRIGDFIERENYFLADVSHELRTPLAIISGALEVLEEGQGLTDKQRQRLDRIRRAKRDMSDFVAALMLMAREKIPVAEAPLEEVGELLRQCAIKYKPLMGTRPVRIEVEVTEEPKLFVERPLFEVMVANLLRNAVFNTFAGEISVRLQADKLIVCDTGVGMSKEVLARAFERNFKGETSAGAGIGLSLVKRICQRYGWQISMQSEEGYGTTVIVEFRQNS